MPHYARGPDDVICHLQLMKVMMTCMSAAYVHHLLASAMASLLSAAEEEVRFMFDAVLLYPGVCEGLPPASRWCTGSLIIPLHHKPNGPSSEPTYFYVTPERDDLLSSDRQENRHIHPKARSRNRLMSIKEMKFHSSRLVLFTHSTSRWMTSEVLQMGRQTVC